MSVTIIHKKGSGIPSAESLEVAEVSVDIVTGILYTKLQNGEVVAVGSSDGGGSGAGMVISATEPESPVDGMQWLESTTAIVWIWDEDKWLEFPYGQSQDTTPVEDYDDTALWAAVTSNSTEIAENTSAISALVPYDDTQVKSDIAANTAAIDGKLDANKIWTGTQAQYDNLSPLDATTLYFITA